MTSSHGDGRVVVVDPHADPRWISFVASRPDALVYHHPAWLTVLSRAYGYNARCLAYEDADSRLLGVLPLAKTRGLITGSRLSSLPRTPVAGPLAVDNRTAAAMVGVAVQHVTEESNIRLEVRVSSDRFGESIHGTSRIPAEATYVLDLPAEEGEVRFGNARNHRRIRWSISKAGREGIEVRAATGEDDLRRWYRLYLDTMRFHARPPTPYRFFKAMWEVLAPAGLMRLLLAEQRGGRRTKLAAGAVLLLFGETVLYAYNGRRREMLSLRPNDVIQWHAIQEAHAAGFRRYDFGEVAAGQEGLVQFKKKWGAEERPAYRYVYPPPSDGGGLALGPQGPARRAGEAVWRKLPLDVTARVGELLYRYG